MSQKRFLTEYEINSITDFIIPQKGVPIETSTSVANSNIDSLKKQLVKLLSA